MTDADEPVPAHSYRKAPHIQREREVSVEGEYHEYYTVDTIPVCWRIVALPLTPLPNSHGLVGVPSKDAVSRVAGASASTNRGGGD